MFVEEGGASPAARRLRRIAGIGAFTLLGCGQLAYGARPEPAPTMAPPAASSAASARTAPPADAGARAAFDLLATIVGDWKATTASGKEVRASYRRIANDSALVETFTTTNGTQTITVFHMDGGRILATHYCAQGNQPRLVLSEATTTELHFEFLDATNLLDPEASHLQALGIVLRDDMHFDKLEDYREAGKEDVTRLAFERVVSGWL